MARLRLWRYGCWPSPAGESLFGWIGPKALVQPRKCSGFQLRRVAVRMHRSTVTDQLKSSGPHLTVVTLLALPWQFKDTFRGISVGYEFRIGKAKRRWYLWKRKNCQSSARGLPS